MRVGTSHAETITSSAPQALEGAALYLTAGVQPGLSCRRAELYVLAIYKPDPGTPRALYT